MVGGCETEAKICGDRWVDRFDLVLVSVSYGFVGFDLVLVSYGFDRLMGFDIYIYIYICIYIYIFIWV